jgi:hypothetical protein
LIDGPRLGHNRGMTRRLALLALLLAAPTACDKPDDSDDDVAETTDATDSDASDSSDDSGSDGATSEGGPEDFPPVACGDVMCVEGEVCVMPAEQCDYDQDPPMWVQDPSVCAAVPTDCYGLTEQALNECLDGALCTGGEEFSYATLVDGVLDCPANGADCF